MLVKDQYVKTNYILFTINLLRNCIYLLSINDQNLKFYDIKNTIYNIIKSMEYLRVNLT